MTTTHPSGFAPAASPLAPTMIHTPDGAISAGITSIPSQGDDMPAYYARPKASDGALPVVIVVQEIFGVHEHIRDICRRLALEGYLAIAPELYFREGDPNDFADIPTLLSGLVGDTSLNSPKHPVDIATDLNAPVLGLYGGQDTSIPQESVETMRQALRAANAKAEIVVYPDAGHAFNADYRPGYHEASAKDGWQRMLEWFAQYGGKKG
ncbi:dienelactone hydrolase family protein [Salmonella enterica]|nr:dienelactone hydrolase family protein [Salmonella enterica]ELT7031375.1 dienelactone hydrolase family protein [Salmonella enterica]